MIITFISHCSHWHLKHPDQNQSSHQSHYKCNVYWPCKAWILGKVHHFACFQSVFVHIMVLLQSFFCSRIDRVARPFLQGRGGPFFTQTWHVTWEALCTKFKTHTHTHYLWLGLCLWMIEGSPAVHSWACVTLGPWPVWPTGRWAGTGSCSSDTTKQWRTGCIGPLVFAVILIATGRKRKCSKICTSPVVF